MLWLWRSRSTGWHPRVVRTRLLPMLASSWAANCLATTPQSQSGGEGCLVRLAGGFRRRLRLRSLQALRHPWVVVHRSFGQTARWEAALRLPCRCSPELCQQARFGWKASAPAASWQLAVWTLSSTTSAWAKRRIPTTCRSSTSWCLPGSWKWPPSSVGGGWRASACAAPRWGRFAQRYRWESTSTSSRSTRTATWSSWQGTDETCPTRPRPSAGRWPGRAARRG
mmetsp:Transcript_61037/g.109883  ORF Transcript_61037/g.109883 Transcript_61037/m.109883 type:complete len:225 (+) Transcript_61037:2107-2781(+)